jgi:hypothetical protein
VGLPIRHLSTVSLVFLGVTSTAGQSFYGPIPPPSAPVCQPSTAPPPPGPALPGSRFGVYRNPNTFVLDSNGDGALAVPPDRYINGFFTAVPVNGTLYSALATDLAVAGDWTGDGHWKIGIYRPTSGQWFLDNNNNGILDPGDTITNFGGIAGDLPVVGDWAGLAKTCIGVFRQGFLWVLDLNCNGTFDGAGPGQPDISFGFGGLAGDVPVSGAFTGGTTRAAFVRAYAPSGVQQGPPFLWVIDNVPATDKTQTDHVAATGTLAPFPFGGVPCKTAGVPGCSTVNPLLTSDIYVAGDWENTGAWRAGIYRAGSWILDLGLGGAGVHTYDTFYQFGGCTGANCGGQVDQPVAGKW